MRLLLDRLDRISRAIEIGTDGHRPPRPLVRTALTETVHEAVFLGFELTRVVAYNDIWSQLDALLGRWGQIVADVARVRAADVDGLDIIYAADDMRLTVRDVRDAARVIDGAQVELMVTPDNQAAQARLDEAISSMERAADQAFLDSLMGGPANRNDAALALLTTVAARGMRERTTARAREA